MEKVFKTIKRIIVVIAGTFIVSLITFVIIMCFSRFSSADNMILRYGEFVNVLAENDEYISYEEENRIVIKDKDDREVVSFDPQEKEICPDQMAFGKEGFYLLEWDDASTETFRDAIIVQFDYEANEKHRMKVQNAECLTCQGGYLFLGKFEESREKEPQYLKGIWAQYYSKETEFGNDWKKMKGEKGKKVEVGNISFYYHGDGYYCTEPDLDGYCGVSSNDLRVKDGEEYLADMKNKREQENLKLLLKEIAGSKSDRCQCQDYQDGEYIYGICNLYNAKVEEEGIPVNKVQQAVFYRIDCPQNTIKILKQCENVCAVFCAEDYVLYEKENAVYKDDIVSGQSEKILSVDKSAERRVNVNCGILEVCNPQDYKCYKFAEKAPLTESSDITPVTDTKPEHNYYVKAMKDEKNDINYVEEDGRFAYKYCFYDIDQNGVDELIVHGSYYNYSIYTLKGSKVKGLAWNKYGGGLKIYPAKGLISWTGGHKDNYYIEFFRIKGNEVKESASQSWRNRLTEEDVYPYHYVYKVNGKKVTKKRYKKYVAALEKKKVIKGKDLKWRR